MSDFIIKLATESDCSFAEHISLEMEASARARGTGIAKRSPEYIQAKIRKAQAFIAIALATQDIAGFCYTETWSSGRYVANSGLIIFPNYRRDGLARRLKTFAFEESKKRYPEAKFFGLTTSLAVMNINTELGYRPVTYSELTPDEEFWASCQSCVNYPTLTSKERKNCLCTAMLFDPERERRRQLKLAHAQALPQLERQA